MDLKVCHVCNCICNANAFQTNSQYENKKNKKRRRQRHWERLSDLVSENDLFLTLRSSTSGKYGLRNHFLPLESRFLMRKSKRNSIFLKPPHQRIFIFWILNVHNIMCQIKKKSTVIHFFSQSSFLPLLNNFDISYVNFNLVCKTFTE